MSLIEPLLFEIDEHSSLSESDILHYFLEIQATAKKLKEGKLLLSPSWMVRHNVRKSTYCINVYVVTSLVDLPREILIFFLRCVKEKKLIK